MKKSISDKIITIIVIFIFSAGFLAGRYSVKKSTQTKIQTQIKSVSQVHLQADDKKDSIAVKQTISVKKVFNNAGKLSSETVISTNFSNNIKDIKKTASSSQEKQNYSQKTTQESVEKNWGIGVFTPASKNLNYTIVEPQISYRIFKNVWISAQSDIKFTDAKIGVQILF